MNLPALLAQALGEYGALTGGGSAGGSGAAAWVTQTVGWVSEHRLALAVVAGLAVLWIIYPTRSPD